MEYVPYFWMFITLLGLLLGSFYACSGYRIPNKISMIKSRSFCPHCKNTIKWWMNIPVISYLLLGGRCFYCKKKISLMYPIVEITTAFLATIGYFKFGLTTDFIIFFTICSAFMITCVSDFRYYYVSDRVLLISGIIIVLARMIDYGLKGTLYSLTSGLIMFTLMVLVRFIGNKAFKKECLGWGDIKIMALVGFALGNPLVCNFSNLFGIVPSLFTVFFASVLALPFAIYEMVTKKDQIVAFGPYLFLGAMIIMYFYEPLKVIFDNYFLG